MSIVFTEFVYWNARRPLSRLRYRALRMIPNRILYWFTIEAAIRAEPQGNPGETRMIDALKKLEVK